MDLALPGVGGRVGGSKVSFGTVVDGLTYGNPVFLSIKGNGFQGLCWA